MKKVAIIHDWLIVYAGGEKVLEQILNCFPQADLFSSVDFLDEEMRDNHFLGKRAITSFIQRLPWAKSRYRAYLSMMPMAIEQLDLSAYDLVISSSHAVAKGVITSPNQLHISYVHSPMRYAWDLQSLYFTKAGYQKGIKSWIMRYLLHRIRLWDYCSAARPDYLIANSQYIAKRINKVYRRTADVIYPPIDTESFQLTTAKENFYITASRFVPYKCIDVIIRAFTQMPDKKLIIIGDGPENSNLRKLATTPNIEFKGFLKKELLLNYIQKAQAFIFAGEEDFGIAPTEAQACGTPVIAFGRGGVREIVQGLDQKNPTGLFFENQTPDAIVEAVHQFEKMKDRFTPIACRHNAERIGGNNRFRLELMNYVEKRWKEFFGNQKPWDDA